MNAHIVYRKELFLKGVAYVLICLLLGLMATYLLKSRAVSIILLILMVLPVFFMRIVLKLFTKKVFIDLYSDHFIVRILNRDGSEAESEINLIDILSYSIQFPTDSISDIKFKLRNGAALYYSFSKIKQTAEDTDSEELINSFHSLINNYNRRASSENKIVLLPSFYASITGLVVIGLLSALLILTIIIVSLFKGASSLPFTFVFTVLIIFQLIVKRKKELDYYKRTRTQ